jgi:hypothetical protein
MKFRYCISHIPEDSTQRIRLRNFNSKKNLIQFLNSHAQDLHSLKQVRIHFASIDLPLKDTVWKNA